MAALNESKLIATTRDLLQARSRLQTYAVIAENTGLTVRWLAQFANSDASDDFSATRVETLYNYLSGKPLDL